ncbi:MAG: hypothetical protein NUV53_02855 [Patescibacteria group bacterium]|nr:hypothetical protein [Patescibacteria group bacterium]
MPVQNHDYQISSGIRPLQNRYGAIRAYLKVFTLSLKESLYYPDKLFASVFIVAFRIIMMLLIYSYAFRYIGRTVNGIDATTAIWSIAIYHLLLYAQFRAVFKTINDEMKSGALETQINKPYSYLFYKFWEQLGKGILNFFVALAVVIPLLLALLGSAPGVFSLSNLFAGIVLAVGGTIVSAALYMLIALPALWIDDAQPLYWISDKAVLILGGSYVPLAMLPHAFHTFANFTPFGAPMFATQMFNPNFSTSWWYLVLLQMFWIIVLGGLILFFFEKVRRRLAINGG